MLHTRFENGSGSIRRRNRKSLQQAAHAALETLENRQLLSVSVAGFGNIDPNNPQSSDSWTVAQAPGSSDYTWPQFETPNNNAGGPSNDLQITAGNSNQGTAAWYNTAVPFQNFTADFDYEASYTTSPPADGFTFGFQNDPRSTGTGQGLSTVVGGTGGGLGYSGIAKSFSVQFNIYNGSKIGSGSNGTVSDQTGTGALNLAANAIGGLGDVIHIHLAYDSSKNTLSELLTDTNNQATYSQVFTNVNLGSITGSSSAFMGFTGGTGGAWAYQDITNFQFQTNPTPPPPAGAVSGFGSWQLQGANGQGIDGSATQDNNNGTSPLLSSDKNTLTLTAAGANQASSAFYNATDLYQNFESNFTYTESGANTGGFTFTLQNDSRGANALGGGGTDLGYGTDSSHPAQLINNSVALEFNSANSTVGVAHNGTLIGTAQSTGAVSLTSGDPIAVKVDYNSSTITVTLTDTKTNGTPVTLTFNNLNLPVLLGSNQAYVGLTGGTGTTFASQVISGFSFIPNTAPNPATLNTDPTTTGGTAVTGFSGSATNGITLNAANAKGLNGSAPNNSNPGNTPSVTADGNTLTLTTNNFNEASSAFFNVPVSFNNFTASFTYQEGAGAGGNPPGSGFAFVLENDQRGVNAIGGGSTDLGYGSDGNNPASAISSSFGAAFMTVGLAGTSHVGTSQVGVGTNGGFSRPTVTTDSSGNAVANNNTGKVNIASGHPIQITLNYDSARKWLDETLTDTTTHATYVVGYSVNLAGLGNNGAFLGFTGGTSQYDAAQQTISNFTYSTAAAPTMPTLPASTNTVSSFSNFDFNGSNADPIGLPGTSSDKNTLTLTTQNNSEATTAFNDTPVPYGNFTTSFTYTDTNGGGPADGFTFNLSDVPALGGGGGSVGYGGSNNQDSFAVAFNIYNSGQSGIGTDGRINHNQGTGSVNIRNSGDPINVSLTYNSSAMTLTETLTDTQNTANTYTTTYNNVDLGRILRGASSVYVGFTGGTGGANATQTFSNFTYSASASPTAAPGPQVNLGGDVFQYGIGIDGQNLINGGLDGSYGLSNTFFQTNGSNYRDITLNGATQRFNFMAPASNVTGASNANSLSGAGQIINLPQGKYGNLSFLGTAVNGNQNNQKFTVIYTDGTTQTFTQTMSDWFTGTPATGEQVAINMNYRINGSGGQANQGASIHVYEYNFALDSTKTAASLVLPNDGNIKILAMNVNAVPTVTGLSPATGPTTGGTSVTITGTGFSTATGVKFGNTAATSYTINSDSSITAVAPAGTAAGPVDVTVTNIAGTSATGAADQFTYSQAAITVTGAVINGDNPNGLYNAAGQSAPGAQRSMVEDIVYTFSAPVTITDANAAFTVVGAGAHPGTAPTTLFAQAVAGSNGTQWAVSLTGQAEGTMASIANGEYTITVNPNAVFAASDGVTPIASGRTDNFYRLYGDVFATENVTALDYNRFKGSLTTYNPMFDNYNTGTITALDYNLFKKDLSISYAGDGFTTTI